MKLIFQLTTISTIFLLFTTESEGVKCYFCEAIEQARTSEGATTDTSEEIMSPMRAFGDPDPTCKTSKPKNTKQCEHGCATRVEILRGRKKTNRECRDSKSPSSGCTSTSKDGFSKDVCYCTSELCNRSYALSNKWILMAMGLGTAVSIGHSLV